MAVVLAFALMTAPVAEAAVCSNEAPAAVAQQVLDDGMATSDSATVASDTPGSPAPDVGGDRGLCQHGHCHHATPYPPSLAVEVVAHPTVTSLAVKVQSQHARSRAISRLERPPRV